jgi:hypothetical protein
VTERKALLVRMDPGVHEALERWARDELRSVNAQIEFLLKESARKAGRWRPKEAASVPPGAPGLSPTDAGEGAGG